MTITIIAGLELLVIAYSIWAMLELSQRAKEERRELEDRLMAICQPIPLTQIQVSRKDDSGTVKYVDYEPQTARVKPKEYEV